MPKAGDTITDGKGHFKQWNGSAWADTAAIGSPLRPPVKMTAPDKKMLNTQLDGAMAGMEARELIKDIAPAVKRLGGGPFRGMFLDAALPNSGGFWDKIGSAVIGGPAKVFGALPDDTIKDYQIVNRAANLSTRQSVTGEKGTQTEGDAARALVSTITAGTTPEAADQMERDINAKAERQQGRPQFYTVWANKYGLNQPDEHGRDVETAFQQTLNSAGAPVKRMKYNPATGEIE